jgi:ABC-type transport system involved in multi-copper enzyme maturation permease subunit
VSGAVVVAGYALRESLRRRVFVVVLLLTLLFLGLFAFATAKVFEHSGSFTVGRNIGSLDAIGLVTSTMLGLGMFAILFLATVLAVFLTLGAVRGDAERGLLQPLVVRPLGRTSLLLGRFAAAAAVCAAYALLVYAATTLIVHQASGRWPDTVIGPGLALAAGSAVIVALALLGSVFLSATANGIVTFMLFGAGLVAGLMQSIADAIGSHSLGRIAHAIAIALPFEALYQAGLHALTADQSGFTGALIQLGPFGSSHAGGPLLDLWAAAYVALAGGLAAWGFARRDL